MKQAIQILALSALLAVAWVKLFERKHAAMFWMSETIEHQDGETVTISRSANFKPDLYK